MNAAAVSPPYLDANGGGLVLTLSSAIMIPKEKHSSDQAHNIFGVMGADILLEDFQQLLFGSFPHCEENISCIAIDTSGWTCFMCCAVVDRINSARAPFVSLK